MDVPQTAILSIVDTELYAELQQFYAGQMQLLDAGHTEQWAHTFTDDGVFDVGGEQVRGAHHIAHAATRVAEQFAAADTARRHVVTMLTARRDQDAVATRCYALVLEITRGGEVVVKRSTVCTDILVRGETGWLVHHRRVTRDGLD